MITSKSREGTKMVIGVMRREGRNGEHHLNTKPHSHTGLFTWPLKWGLLNSVSERNKKWRNTDPAWGRCSAAGLWPRVWDHCAGWCISPPLEVLSWTPGFCSRQDNRSWQGSAPIETDSRCHENECLTLLTNLSRWKAATSALCLS